MFLSELPIFLFLVCKKGPKNVKMFHVSESRGPIHGHKTKECPNYFT